MPLLSALKWIYGFVGNYGWSIIVLTILINLVIFPLRHKSVVSMRKMQAAAAADEGDPGSLRGPEGRPIRREQKMNTEIMNLYREKGVNPASGCVPMLLTMPVLFAFYSLLSLSIELRGAPFGLLDSRSLASTIRYYVTPLLMGVTMFWQQKMTPSTADPAQQRVMMIMPLMFTCDVPAGAERPGALLVRQQPLGDRPAVLHQLVDRSAGGPDGAAAGGAAAEERRQRARRAEADGQSVHGLRRERCHLTTADHRGSCRASSTRWACR